MIFQRGSCRAARNTGWGDGLGSSWAWQQHEVTCRTDIPHGLLSSTARGAARTERHRAFLRVGLGLSEAEPEARIWEQMGKIVLGHPSRQSHHKTLERREREG